MRLAGRVMWGTPFLSEVDGVGFGISFELLGVAVFGELKDGVYELDGV